MKNNINYHIIVGLEVHCQLNTKTKLFSPAPNMFVNNKPNTLIHSIDLGAPGTLPVVNKRAVELAILSGFLFNMEINNILRFDRKNYFYPDLPKGYQITQYYEPICKNGILDGVNIDRLFIEEDTAKQIHHDDKTYIDYNRCGAPLIEVVTAPFFVSSSSEVISFINKFITTLKSLDITKGNLHEGEMRFDVNISLSDKLNRLSAYKVEIKNLNSLKNIDKAINYEFERQRSILIKGNTISSETRRFDEKTQTTILMRKKLSINDYKFFSEPSILPIYLDKIISEQKKVFAKYLETQSLIDKITNLNVKDWIKNIIESQYKFDSKYVIENLDLIKSFLLDIDKKLFFNNPKKATNIALIQNNFEKYFKANKVLIENFDSIYQEWERKLLVIDNSIDISKIIANLVKLHPNVINDYKINPNRIEKFLMGNVFKETKGKANPEIIMKEIKKYFS